MAARCSNSEDSKPQSLFKKRAKKNIRLRKTVDDDSDNEENTAATRETLDDLKELQKLREKPRGVNIVDLNAKPVDSSVKTTKDPWKTQSGGMVDMVQLKSGGQQCSDDAYETGIGTAFSIETNKRDEDDEMMRYIEDELKKRKGVREDEQKEEKKYLSPEEAALLQVPEYLRKSSSNRNEEMLSNQMLSGIPEVDLGIDIKIRNIEETEAAKLKMVKDSMKKKETPSEFVPTNYAVNYVQHNRFNLEDKHKLAAKPLGGKPPQFEKNTGKRKDLEGKPTDDFHYEKFKKQFKR